MKRHAISYLTIQWVLYAPAFGVVTDGFDYPICNGWAANHSCAGFTPTPAPDGDCWYNANDFGNSNSGIGSCQSGSNCVACPRGVGHHLGEDWNLEISGTCGADANADCGRPVFAAANGTIVFAGTGGGVWGRVLIITHTLPGGQHVQTLYGHLQSSVSGGSVIRGQQIGTIGDGNGSIPCHLHFELRTSDCPHWGVPGCGHSIAANPTGWMDPSEFIDANRPGPCQAAWNGTIGQPGFNGPVKVLMGYNGDLIAGGSFTMIGGQTANRIARWNGTSWSPLGTGMDNGEVRALTIFNGSLIAGGSFTTPNRVAQWNGASWQTVGAWPASGDVTSLAVYGVELMAGSGPGTGFSGQVQSWNGSNWLQLGPNMNSEPQVLTNYDGEIVVGNSGFQSNLFRWTGTAWVIVGSGLGSGSSIRALTLYNNELVAAGDISTPTGNIARLNGNTWQALGTGLNGTVRSLTVYNGELIAGGLFTTAGGVPANRIARWSGSSWAPLGNGSNNTIHAVAPYSNQLIAGGEFVVAGGQPANRIAAWLACPPPTLPCTEDVTGDGLVNIDDLLAVISGWGVCPP